MIPFNRPFTSGKGIVNIQKAISNDHLSGNGPFTKFCENLFTTRYNFNKCLLTNSCTDALEMASMLLGIKSGDEVIVPSFTFVSTALAFARQGAIIKFIDSRPDHPGLDEALLESLITEKTKAIVPVHYAGVACDMDKIIYLSEKYQIPIVEDAAHSIDSFYKGIPLGRLGQLGCFSFHETKNIHCGEGGMITINNPEFSSRSEILREKGTNKSSFDRGDINFYEWVDIGSSFLPSELNAAFLLDQIEGLDQIQNKRKTIWDLYYNNLKELEKKGLIQLPVIPDYAVNNGSMFYIVCKKENERSQLIQYLYNKGIQAVFHYRCLHKSQFMNSRNNSEPEVLINAESYEKRLLRLPLYFSLSENDQEFIVREIIKFYNFESHIL